MKRLASLDSGLSENSLCFVVWEFWWVLDLSRNEVLNEGFVVMDASFKVSWLTYVSFVALKI